MEGLTLVWEICGGEQMDQWGKLSKIDTLATKNGLEVVKVAEIQIKK